MLDREVLDAAAERLLAGRVVDLAAVHERAARADRRRRRRTWGATLGTMVAAAAAVLLVAAGAVPGLRLPDPLPAKAPAGPGAVPSTVRAPARWEPSATQSPLTRVAYVLSDVVTDEGQLTSGHPVWLIGADGGAYRWLPAAEPRYVTVSPDGRRVAWNEPNPGLRFPVRPVADVVKVLDVPSGTVRSLRLPGLHGRGFDVAGAAFSRDGTRLAVWGRDRVTAGDPSLTRVLSAELGQVGQQRAIREPAQVCSCGAVPYGSAYAWGPTGGLVGPGAGRLPAVAGTSAAVDGLQQVVTQPVLLSGDGRSRWVIAESGSDGPNSFGYRLLPGSGAPVDLGTHAGVVGLGVTGRGVAVSRWSLGAGNGGPSDVVIAGPVGLSTVTRAVSPNVRVVAAAAAVLEGGRVEPAAAQRVRALDLHWYGWLVRSAATWMAGWPSGLLIGLGVAVLLLLWRLLPLPVRAADLSLVPRRARWVLAIVAALGAVLLGAVSVLSPSVADRPAPAAGGGPVLPRVIADQDLHPPRAYEVQGKPLTRRLTVLLVGVVAGRGGVYGVDAATGALVQVDDQAVSDQDASPFLPQLWSLSPNGRYVSSPQGVLDLETATVRRIPGLDLEQGRVAVLDDGTLVAPAGNSARSVTVSPPTGTSRTLAAARATVSVEGQVGRRVLLRFFPAGGSGDSRRPADRLAGVLDLRTGRISDVLTEDGQNKVLAVTARGEVVDASGRIFGPADGSIRVPPVALKVLPEPVLDQLAVSSGGLLLAVGAGTVSPTGVLIRPASASTWTQVTQLRLPGVQHLSLATDLFAQAAT